MGTKEARKEAVRKLMDEHFTAKAREILEVEEGDYYWDEFLSGLDHLDCESISELCKIFFLAGKDSAVEIIKLVREK